MAGVNSSLLHPSRVRQVRPPAQAQVSMPRASSATPSMAHGSASPASAVSMVPSQPFLHGSSARAKIRRPSFGPSHSPKPVSSQKVASMSYSPLPGQPQMPFGCQQVSSYTPPPGAPHASFVGHASTTPNTGLDSLRAKSVPPQRANEEEQRYGPHVDVEMGEYRFRCINVLGRGSYSEVWRAEVTSPCIGFSEAALKEVKCSSQAELQQAIFEVQVLLALECSGQPLRVPRCIAYKVDPCQAGWKVRTAMTVVPGEALDVFVRRTPPDGFTHQAALRRGVTLATKMIRDIGPTLQLLAPIAWHRDVNSHNILIDKAPENVSMEELSAQATFWLIDFGLAVDSQSWVTSNGRWRTEYIGGDSRYWPPSSWIMHLLGPDGFEGEEQLCEQYQRRLDIHGLGITALELLCTIALASPPDDGAEQQPSQGAWIELFTAWQQYRDDVWRWWSAVYSVFSTGADIAPVQAQLVQDRIIEQLIVLLSNIRSALRRLAKELHDDRANARLLEIIADMIDEGSGFELANLEQEFGDVPISKPAAAAMPFQHAPSSHGYDLSYNSQSPVNESISPVPTRGPSMQSPLRGMVNSGSCSNAMTAAAAASAAASGRRQVHSLAREAAQSLESDGRGRTEAPWYHRSIDSNGAHIGYIRAGPSTIDTRGRMTPQPHSRNPSLERVHVRHLGVERPCSPVRLQAYERPSQASVSPVRLRPYEHSPDRARSPVRVQFDRARSPVWTHSTRVPSLEREPQVPQAASHLPPWTGVLLPATMPVNQQRAVSSRVGVSPGRHSPSAPLGRRRLDASAGTSGGSWVARGQDGVSEWSASPAGGSAGISVMPLAEGAHGSSPRLRTRTVLDAGPAVSTSSLSMRCATLQQGGSQKADIGLAANGPAPTVSAPWLPAPRERNLVPGGPDLTSVGPGQSSSPSFGVGAITPRVPAHISSLTSQNRSGDGDIGAGPPNPHASAGATSVNTNSNAGASASVDSSQEALRARIRSLEASGNEHEKLRERIKNLEESLQRLGKESLERAKLGMEKLAEKYFPHTPSDDVFDGLPRSSALDGPYVGTAFPSDFIIPQRMAT